MPWPNSGSGLVENAASPALGAGAFDFISDGMVVLSRGGLITQANAKALAILRTSLPEVIGKDLWDVVPLEVAERHQSETDRAVRARGEHTFVVNFKFEDAWTEYAFRKYPEGYVVNLKDVAELSQLEKLLDASESYNQLVFDANPIAMWMFDVLSLRILAANQAAVAFYGIPHQQFLKMSLDALFPDGETSGLLASIASGKGLRHGRFQYQLCKQQKLGGAPLLVELAFGQLKWQGHNAVLVSVADVAERHLADRTLRRANGFLEQQLSHAKTELAHVNRDMAAFTYALSNDLQAPLHVTNGFAGMLAEKYAAVLDEQGMHYVGRIRASTRDLAQLVDDLRVLVQLPQMNRTAEQVDLAPICELIVAKLGKREPGRHVVMEIANSLMLGCDRALMTTALSCLLGNAWKFTARKPEGWIKVELQPGTDAAEIVLQVSDNGVGFDAAYASKLFNAFQRLHSTADFPGHGLGLAIVKRVSSRHGGRVWGATTEHGGASFFMAFPLAAQPCISAPGDPSELPPHEQ
ncbi:MAG: sensor signal transduction histidine kinase [Polaromonas sp.]|nr:sensor signal transduction histidine kinase [Polaromonas sp.]